MKQISLALLLLHLAFALNAQKTAVHKSVPDPNAATDRKALALPETQTGTTADIAAYINANFTADSDKARAIFIWTAANLQYDAANMFAINFYEKPEEKIAKALKTRKGICANYAALFNDIAVKCGLTSYVVAGYTKQNGFADYIPHVWCAAMVNGQWWLFDPTWGSGYISNGKFVRKIDNSYYKASPAVFIKSHMPFDPMWELLNYPVTNQEFYEGAVKENKSKPYFSYTDTMAAYEQMGQMAQYEAEARRVEANGVKNSLIYDRLMHLKQAIEIYNNQQAVNANNAKVDTYNSAVADYNGGANSFNEFINYRNSQFKPSKPDADIQAMLDAGYNKFASAKNKLEGIKDPDASIAPLITQLIKAVDDGLAHAGEQEEWLKKYFSKGRMGRASMFTKYTWMGIPLN